MRIALDCVIMHSIEFAPNGHPMTQILLVRHAVNDFVKTGKLAGWTPEVHLNDEGKAQAEALGKRLADVPIQHLYASPLERTNPNIRGCSLSQRRPARIIRCQVLGVGGHQE